MERSALSGQSRPEPNDAPSRARCFWARPSFGAEPVLPGRVLIALRGLVLVAFLVFIATGETTGASPWHIGAAAVVVGLDVGISTLLLVRASPSPDRIFRVWALIVPLDILAISLAASLDHRNPSVIPTVALASVFNASVMFRARDTLLLGGLAAVGVIAAVIPRHGLAGVDLETVLQALITLVVTGFAIARGRMEEGLRRTLMAARSREHEQNEGLRESEARFHALFDRASDGIILISSDFQTVAVSKAFARMHGYSVEEMQTVRLQDLDTPASALLAPERARRLLAGESLTFEVEHYHRDGHAFPLEVSASLVSVGGQSLIQSFHRDITGRRQAEEDRRKFDLQVQDAQRLESLGVLAGGIAHDFNNLLTVVLGNASLALLKVPPESPAREVIESIEVAAQRAADLTAQMLAYSGKGIFLLEPINLASLVDEMSPLVAIVISPKSILEYHFDPGTPFALADSAQVRQVVMSLITNASEALGDAGGFITISTGMLSADRAYLSETYLDNDLPEGDYVFLQVADTGSGIYEETRLRIFEPFFTTKFTGRGLGLAAVLGIVRGHNGAIKVASEVGRGTIFTVLLPVAEPSTTLRPFERR